MAYLGNIIHTLEKHFFVKAVGPYHTRAMIHTVLFWDVKSSLPEYPEDVLYITNEYDELAILPVNLLLVGREHENLLHIQKEIPLTDIFNVVQDLLLKQNLLRQKREALFHALYSEDDIHEMTKVAYSVLGNQVNVCDTGFFIVSSFPVLKDDAHLDEVNGRRSLKEEVFQDMLDKKIIEHIYSSRLPYIFYVDHLHYPWAYQSIRIHDMVAGYVCVRGSNRKFTEDDMEFMDIFSKMLSIALQKDTSFQPFIRHRYEYSLIQLLEGNMENAAYFLNHYIASSGKAGEKYSLLLFRISSHKKKSRQPGQHFEQIHSILPNAMTVIHQKDIVSLIPFGRTENFGESQRKRLEVFLKLNQIDAYLSYSFEDISETRFHYLQIKKLCEHLSSSDAIQPVLYEYKDYFLEHIFSAFPNKSVLRASIHPDIRYLMSEDAATKNEYIKTLHTYLKNNQNAAETAGELHIHKSTLFYRLGKIKSLLNVDLNNSNLLFSYLYSLRALKYFEKNDSGL